MTFAWLVDRVGECVQVLDRELGWWYGATVIQVSGQKATVKWDDFNQNIYPPFEVCVEGRHVHISVLLLK